MELSCTKENLKKAISNIDKISNKQTPLPILKNIMLKAREGKLLFYATNLEIGIISSIRAKVEVEGEFSIPARLLSDFVNNLADKNSNIEIKLEGGLFLNVESGSCSAKIKGLTCEDFPIIPKPTKNNIMSVENSLLKESVLKVLGCVSTNDARLEFKGVNMLIDGEEIFFASTDSFKLSESRISFKDGEVNLDEIDRIKKDSIIIPAEALVELGRVIGNESGKTDISIEDNQIFFTVNQDTQIVSRLINGKYPNYKQIIPSEFKTEMILNKEELLRAVKLASVFTNNNSKEVSLGVDLDKKSLVVESKFQDLGENRTELSLVKVSGENQNIILNPRYIIDGLNLVSSQEVIILMNDNTSPIAFRGIKDNKVNEDHIYIMMPIKK